MGLSFTDRKVVRAALVVSLLLICWQLYTSSFYDRIYFDRIDLEPSPSPKITCTPEPGLNDVLVIIKTGATESESKLPVHFNTTLQCVPNWIVYSDFGEQVEGQEVHDTLDQVSDQVKQTNPDFELYNRLLRDGRAALNSAELDSWSQAANTASGTQGNPAWKLDKWKFLPLVDKALQRKPDAKWFIFAEADTYVNWHAMVQWLGHYNASEPVYLGNQMQIGDVVFGYGGAGWVVSAPAMRMVAEQRAARLAEYDHYTALHWAGDCVLGKAFLDAGVQLTWAWPNLVGGFAEVDYSAYAYGKRLWCHQSVSHHHMSPEDIREMWEFEQIWYSQNTTSLRHKDLFEHFVLPRLRETRDYWSNLSEMPVEDQTLDSFEACGQACRDQPGCLQYSFSGEGCRVSNTTMLGKPSPDKSKPVTSGWLLDRIEESVRGFDECDGHEWVLPYDF